MDRILKKAGSPLLIAAVAAAGILMGVVIGSILVRSYFSGGSRAIFLITEPAVEYQHIRARIAGGSPEERVAAYYALLEYGKADAEFLIERYRREKPAYIRRILVWSMGFSGNRDEVSGFIRKAYGESEPLVKKEMIRTLSRIGDAGAEELKQEVKRRR
jgi:hypothetical protein